MSITSNSSAFAAIRANGAVVTWGQASNGGNSSSVADALNGPVGVVSIFSNGTAFAALRADGSVVTWGNADAGGNSSSVANRLRYGVTQLISLGYSNFGALFDDGSALVWGGVFRRFFRSATDPMIRV